jgi:undecaprenyl diphosphate synthase
LTEDQAQLNKMIMSWIFSIDVPNYTRTNRQHIIHLMILITCSVLYSFKAPYQKYQYDSVRHAYFGQLFRGSKHSSPLGMFQMQNSCSRRTVLAGKDFAQSNDAKQIRYKFRLCGHSDIDMESDRGEVDGISRNSNDYKNDQWSSTDSSNNHRHSLNHVAYIVDGNGRWAAKNNMTRMEGHNLGANVTVEIVKESFALGIKVVTLYLFSTENWKRSNEEILNIMFLLEKYLRDFSVYLKENNIRVRVIGQRHRLSDSVQLLLKALETSQLFNNDENAVNQRTLCLAVSYGGRDDIIEATKQIAELVSKGKLKNQDITEEIFSEYTMTGRIKVPALN